MYLCSCCRLVCSYCCLWSCAVRRILVAPECDQWTEEVWLCLQECFAFATIVDIMEYLSVTRFQGYEVEEARGDVR